MDSCRAHKTGFLSRSIAGIDETASRAMRTGNAVLDCFAGQGAFWCLPARMRAQRKSWPWRRALRISRRRRKNAERNELNVQWIEQDVAHSCARPDAEAQFDFIGLDPFPHSRKPKAVLMMRWRGYKELYVRALSNRLARATERWRRFSCSHHVGEEAFAV